MQSMGDVVRYMPGITIGQGEGNRDQTMIRGTSSTADFYVNGVRDDVQYFRDLYNVERVEAIKGSNAMMFGRGGGGGVINRTMKEAGWRPMHELVLETGSFDHARVSTDAGIAPMSSLAARVTGVYESSGSFRDGVRIERYGVNPTATIVAGAATRLILDYEHFRDNRTADRGIPSFKGRPINVSEATFFGDPLNSNSDIRVNAASAALHVITNAGITITNRTRVALYDKAYQNVFSGAVAASGSEVSIQAYNQKTRRNNLFNQTDVALEAATGRIRHAMLVGAEAGRQATAVFRSTGFFNGTATSVLVPITKPVPSMPVTYRQGVSDANSQVDNTVLSLYGQNQLTLSSRWQLLAGLRYEIFNIDYHNNRSGMDLSRRDAMLSPRIGAVYKPRTMISLYGSYGVSHLPSSGDQFASLTDVTSALKPERFLNYELGAKWDVASGLSLSTAAYRLDRTNTMANDPNDPARSLQTGSQRTNGFEVDLRGALTPAWDLAAGFSHQNAFISSATSAAPAGAQAPIVPRNAAAIWNRVQLTNRFAVAAGATWQTESFAGIDNSVTLPGFTEVDGAMYYVLGGRARVQANFENLLNTNYYPTAHNNNNISPGRPRSVRVSLTTEF